MLYKEDTKKRYKHFELIEHLKQENTTLLKTEAFKLSALTDGKISEIVEAIPDELMIKQQKDSIKEYIKLRKEKLCEICG